MLAAKEQRLRFLKAQEARGAAAAAEGERLRRLRERVEAQESKLRRDNEQYRNIHHLKRK